MTLSVKNPKKKFVSDLDVIVGRNLRTKRAERGLSQEKLGEGVDLTYQQVQKQENGKNRVSAARLYEYSLILDIPVIEFFEGVEDIARQRIQRRMKINE
ncbi:MAG: hypothetical protein DI551_08355 [Micavibrio aeruginosavorus]|jgi:transcriptional regulator with XRE-family HTH domain|uniref:HTH cro/C1-type domain-containing protein n=1 Tax=Micavibrio aeruginosavorus TaxID=349221 RepID=A0A2W5MVB3_9BACT|nr:MAG: hypothetical protein DI551_08355 [Micavibrio aeruginosavorus]